MTGTPKRKRGRPKSTNPKSAAERMRAYRKRKRDAGLKSVRRWEPHPADVPEQFSDHRILDARSLAMHCRIAQKIQQDPELLEIAKENLARWIRNAGTPVPAYLKEWRDILNRPWPVIANLITSMSEDATRLRSSTPFAGVLSDEERDQIYAAFRT